MSSETEIMMSIIPHNENPTFVTYNFEEHLVAVWSWDDGNALSLTGNSSNHSIGSSKWMDIDNLDGDETDLKLWEFYYCLVKSTEEEKEGDGGDEEHKSSKNLLHLSKMLAKDDKVKAAVGQAVEDALSRAKKRSSSFNANGQSDLDFSDRREYVGQAVEDALSRGKKTFGSISDGRTYNALDGDVEGRNEKSLHNDIHAFKDQYGSVFDIKFTNPIALAALARKPQKTRETVVIEPHNIPHVPKYDASPGVTRQKLDNIASPASESPKRNKCRSKSRSKTSALDKTSSASPADDLDDDDRSAATNNSHTRRKKPASRSPKRNNKRRSKSRSKRSALDKALSASHLLGPPADDLDDDDRSAATNNSHTIRRKNPASRSPKRNKRRSKSRSKRSALDKALSASHLLGPPADGLDDDDRSAATTNSHTRRKKSRDDRRRRSRSGGRNDDDSAAGKSKTKNRKEKRNRGPSKSKKPKMQKGQSSRNVNGERQRSGDDGDEISQLSNALLSPRSTKKKVRRGTWWDGERKCDDDDDDSLQMPIPPRRMMRKGSRKSMSDDDNDRSIHEYGEISLNDVSSTKSSRQRTSSTRNVNRERQSDEDDATSMYGETSSNDSISICTLKSSKSTKKVNRKVTYIRNDYGERGSDDDVDTSQYGETSFNDSISTLMSSIRSTKMSIRNVTSPRNANGERGPDGDDATLMYGETSSNDSISTLKSSRSTKKISPNATYIRNANGQRQPDDDVDTSQYGETSFNDSSSTLQSSIRSIKKGSGKVTSSKNASGARQSDDDDETSTQEYRPASLNDISTCNLEIPRSTRIKGSRRVPRGVKRVKSESALNDSASEWKSKKKAANEKLEALNKRMKNAIGVDMNSIDSDAVSVASGRSLTERRARKRASQAKLKKTFDKIVVDKTLDATKSVGETVGKGAKLGVDVNQTVGKGAMYVTRKGVGKAISVTKSTTPAAA